MDDHVRLIRVNIDTESVSLRTDIADINRCILGDLALDAEVPVVRVGCLGIGIDRVPANQTDGGRARRLRGARHQWNVLIERQIPGIAGARLSKPSALGRGQHERRVE